MPREFMRIHVQQVEVPVEIEDDATEGTPIPRWNINEVRKLKLKLLISSQVPLVCSVTCWHV
jgi:hypothetical protein